MIIRLRFWDLEDKEYTYHDDLDMALAWYAFETGRGEFELSTGLHDKNGKEIYEGDRVRVSHGGRHYWLFEIKALGGQFGNNLYGVCYEHNLSTNEDDSTYTYEKVTGNFYRSECVGGKDAEVIGNIHENPELIK